MGVSKAPPSDSSDPSVEDCGFGIDVVPLSRPPALGKTACGSGKIVRGEETDTTRSRARRYGDRYLYRLLGSSISSANRWIVCGGCFAKFFDSAFRIAE